MEDVLDLWRKKLIDAWEAVMILNHRHDIPLLDAIDIMDKQIDNKKDKLEKETNLLKQLNEGIENELS